MNNGLARKLAIIGCLILALTVAIGAFGAHIIQPRISGHYMDIFRTATHYAFVHALGILFLSIVYHHIPSRPLGIAMRLLLFGIILFSGSLLIISLNELVEMPSLKKFGAIAPIGGLCFIAGWVSAAYAFYQKN